MITEEMLENLIPLNDFPEYDVCDLSAIHDRDSFIDNHGIFGLPCKEFFEYIVSNYGDYKTAYDIGCGCGYLSYGLKKTNPDLNVIAVDDFKSSYRYKHLNEFRLWHPIIDNVDFKSIKNSLVITNWCDYGNDLAYKIAKYLHKSNRMIYIGESEGGCTASDKLFDNFAVNEIPAPWFSWKFIYDQVFEVDLKRINIK